MSLVKFVLVLWLCHYHPLNGTQVSEVVQVDMVGHAALQWSQLAILVELVPQVRQVLPFRLHDAVEVIGDPVLRRSLIAVQHRYEVVDFAVA